MPEWLQVLQGLYKVEMHTVHGSRRGVLYVYDGKMMGGNSAFAFIGTYQESGSGDVSVDISTLRHNDDPKFQPLLKTDGIDGGNTGVMVLHDGRIHGGDAFFDYVGSYSSADGRWKGELVNHEHTPNQGERPVFGGYEVGIGFSGTYTDEGAVAEATALAGKRSIRFS